MAKASPLNSVPGLRVVVRGPERVSCAGHYWVGESQVPQAAYSAAEVQLLRACAQLEVSDIEINVGES
ncbi:MAG TPA: hypothetical protein PLF63_13405 [Rubrivivax sp.]|jgi:hypothetical protein|nr:hypothetical protein [Rubrivivax sp.]